MSSKLQTILIRKFRRRWSDIEFILILEIAANPSTFTQLIEISGASQSGVWHALQHLLHTDDLAFIDNVEGRNFYKLTEKGKLELSHILT